MSSHSIKILFPNLNTVAGPKELMKNISLSKKMKPMWFQCFTKHLCLFAFEVLFALSCLGKRPRQILFMHRNTEALPLVHLTRDQGDFDVYYQSHSFLAPAVQAAHQLHCCTVDGQCNFSMCYHLWEWDLFIDIPFYRQYSTIYLYVLFFCVKVSTLTILYICRWYELFLVLGFTVCFVHDGLFAHLPLKPPPQFILWWFYVTIM